MQKYQNFCDDVTHLQDVFKYVIIFFLFVSCYDDPNNLSSELVKKCNSIPRRHLMQ